MKTEKKKKKIMTFCANWVNLFRSCSLSLFLIRCLPRDTPRSHSARLLSAISISRSQCVWVWDGVENKFAIKIHLLLCRRLLWTSEAMWRMERKQKNSNTTRYTSPRRPYLCCLSRSLTFFLTNKTFYFVSVQLFSLSLSDRHCLNVCVLVWVRLCMRRNSVLCLEVERVKTERLCRQRAEMVRLCTLVSISINHQVVVVVCLRSNHFQS